MNEEVLEQPDDPAEEAFIQSESHNLGDLEFGPYNHYRQILVQSMGLHYGTIDEAGIEYFKKYKIYQGAVRDVAVLLWCCWLKDKTEIIRYSRPGMKDIATINALDWAHEQKFDDINSEKFREAYGIFWKIITEKDESVTVPEQTSNGQSDPKT